MIRPYLGFISITLMPAILACLTISAVPRAGEGDHQVRSPLAPVMRLRRGQARHAGIGIMATLTGVAMVPDRDGGDPPQPDDAGDQKRPPPFLAGGRYTRDARLV
jgi:hypothetical protein